MKIAFLGGGNMATALIGGLVAQGFDATAIRVIEMSPAARERLATQYPVHVSTAPDAAARACASHPSLSRETPPRPFEKQRK